MSHSPVSIANLREAQEFEVSYIQACQGQKKNKWRQKSHHVEQSGVCYLHLSLRDWGVKGLIGGGVQ